MKICFISGVISHSGGTERVGTIIANELSKRGYDISILSFWNHGKPYFDLEKNVKLYYLLDPKKEGKLSRTYIYPVLKLHNFLKKNKFDVIIDIDTLLCKYTCRAMFGIKAKHIAWDHFNYYHMMGDKKRINAFNLAKKYVDKIVLLTKSDLKLYMDNTELASNKLVQIYNPTPFENKLISNREKKILIGVGRLTEQKGFDLLLKSWNLIYKENLEWELNIIGSGEDEIKLKEYVSQNNIGNVKFIESTNLIENWYDKCSVFVVPSRFEGFPMVILEAMSKALPIVSYDCLTGPSEMIEDGVNGFLVENGNIEQFAEKLNMLLNDTDLQDKFSVSTRKKVEEFHLKPIVDKWVTVLKSL